MNHLKIATRLLILSGVLSLILLAVGVLGLTAVSKSNDSLKTVYEDRVVALDQLGDISNLMQRNRILVTDMLLQPSPENIDRRNKELHTNLDKVSSIWDVYKSTYLTPEEKQLADAFDPARKAFEQQGIIPIAAAVVAGMNEEALAIYRKNIASLSQDASQGIHKLNQLQLDVAKTEYASSVARFIWTRNVSIGSIAAGVLFALAFGMMLVRGIGRQLGAEPGEAAELARRIALGDLSVGVHLRQGDQTSMMAQLKRMQDSLVQVVGQVRSGSEGVSTASAEIAQGNHDLSGRTEEQASSLEQTAASMEELSATVKQNAEGAREANQLARDASTVAVRGGEVVGQVVATMRGINESSRKIESIVSVIDGIAFQTNILALNAAVEAARAGEQGRGFAVVASEVRALAGRSADAASTLKAQALELVHSVSIFQLGAGRSLLQLAAA